MPAIDRTTYPKAHRPIGSGYDRRVKGATGRRALIHTTNGRRGSSLRGEALYLLNSDAVGAHFLVGKRGEIIELLDARIYRAWHAGVTLLGWGNNDTTGIECHHAVGEAWTPEQRDALTWLVKDHLQIAPADIETHRAVALPKGRKVDPSDWSDADFYAWRAALAGQRYLPQPALLATYLVTTDVNVREAPTTRKPVALGGQAVLATGFTFQSDGAVPGQSLGGNNQWIHMVTPAAWGFVHSSCVRRVA
jgi:hypothetical protein